MVLSDHVTGVRCSDWSRGVCKSVYVSVQLLSPTIWHSVHSLSAVIALRSAGQTALLYCGVFEPNIVFLCSVYFKVGKVLHFQFVSRVVPYFEIPLISTVSTELPPLFLLISLCLLIV